MDNVKSTDAAREFFENNSDGTVTCEKESGETKECGSFPEAEAFFGEVETQAANEGETANAGTQENIPGGEDNEGK